MFKVTPQPGPREDIMTKVSAVICTLNEKDNIADCIASVSQADEIIVNDDGSTDGTVDIAASLGAHVIRRKDCARYVEPEDLTAYVDRFGWLPTFKPGDRMRHGTLEGAQGFDAASYDWQVCPDADERVSWDLPRLKTEVMPHADHINGLFVHEHNPDGSPVRISRICKMGRWSKTTLTGMTHTTILHDGRYVDTDLIRVDHYQKPGHSQSYVLPIMEYAIIHDDNQRTKFYLAREFYYYQQYEKALTLFNLYLEHADYQMEIARVHTYMAHCYWEDGSGRGDEARKCCLSAILLNPEDQQALALMAEMHFEPWAHKWAHLASVATNEDILF
jgi:glycosyltransferase involved in cell wall biosynthesis